MARLRTLPATRFILATLPLLVLSGQPAEAAANCGLLDAVAASLCVV